MPSQEKTPRRPWLLLTILAALFVLVPFLFWRETWFGRQLSDQEIERYLRDTARPRRIQHALSQISERINRGDPAVRRWYPQIAPLARHPRAEVRATAAWVMGQDATSEEFHEALLGLLGDPGVMVRRNAALALVRFSDASGRDELLRMLRPFGVVTPEPGRVSMQLAPGQLIGTGTLLARIRTDRGTELEVRSPYPGHTDAIQVHDGQQVVAGEQLVSISPEPQQAWEALRGLYLVGQPEDLPGVERYARGVPNMPDRVRQQATLTAQAIRSRSERKASR